MMSYSIFRAGLCALAITSATNSASASYVLVNTIAIPVSTANNVGGKFSSFDISFFDPLTQLDYVADRSNASVDWFV